MSSAVGSRSRRRLRVAVAVLVVALVGSVAAVWILENPRVDSIEVAPPTQDQLEAFADLRIFFAHQSVGRNVLSGVEQTYEAQGSSVDIVRSTTDVPGEAFVAHTVVGENGDPNGKLAVFEQIIDGPMGEQIDVAILKFCYLDVMASTDVEALFAAYSSTISELELRHPDVRFIYTTVPLTTDPSWRATLKGILGDPPTDPADNLARQQYNELVRAQYAASGSLFDIAGVQATLSQHPTEREKDGDEYFVLNLALASDSAHLNALGARVAAVELISVVTSFDRPG